MARELVVTVRVENRAALRALRQLDGVMVSGARTAARSTSAFTGMARGIGMISGGLLGAQGAIAAFRFAKNAAIGMNASIEQSTLQFQTLMGNADQAESHVRSLFEFAKRTPFETGPIIEASKFLQTFGGDALNTMDMLQRLGDAAAATGAPLQNMSMWVGRLHAELQAGRPFGEAAQRLTELAVITPDVRNEMEQLAKAGGTADEIFGVLTTHLEEFGGAMELQAETWAGLTSTFFEGLQLMIAGSAESAGAFDFLKDVLKEANSAMEVMTATGVSRLQIELEQLEQAEAKYIDRLRERVEAGSSLQFQEEQRLERIQKDIVATKAQIAQLDIQQQGEEAFAFAKRQRALAADAVVQAEVAETQAATEAATAAAKLAEEQEKVNAEWRESIQVISVLTTAHQGYNDETTQYLGLMPSVQNMTGKSLETIQRFREDGLIPTTESFAGMLDQGPSVVSQFGETTKAIRLAIPSFQDLRDTVSSAANQFLSFTNIIGNVVTGGLRSLGSLAVGGIMRGLSALFNIGGPSEAELAGREAFAAYRDAVVQGLSEGQIAEAAAAGWANPDDAALFISIRDSFAEIGRTEAEAEAIWHRLVAAIKEGPDEVAAITAELDRAGEHAQFLRDVSDELAPGPDVHQQWLQVVEAMRQGPEAIIALQHELGLSAEAIGQMHDATVSATEGLTGLLDEAERTGELLPQHLEPYLQTLADIGAITGDQLVGIMGMFTESTVVDWKAMEAAAKKYGIELDALGPKFDQARIDDAANEIIKDFELLTGGGVEAGVALHGMTDEVSALVQEAKDAGVQIPADMQPIIEHLFEQGRLTDESGQKLEDLAGVSFADPIVNETELIIDAVRDLIGSIDEAIGAFREMGRASAAANAVQPSRPSGPPPIPVHLPAAQHGGIVTRPTVALVGEAGPEAIIPLGRRGEMGLTVNLDLRGSVVSTSAAVRDLSDRVSATILRQLQTRRRLNPA